MAMKKNKSAAQNKIKAIRQAFADYYRSEGCSCCQDVEGHKEAAAKLAKLLRVPQFGDKSGYNFYKFCSEKHK